MRLTERERERERREDTRGIWSGIDYGTDCGKKPGPENSRIILKQCFFGNPPDHCLRELPYPDACLPVSFVILSGILVHWRVQRQVVQSDIRLRVRLLQCALFALPLPHLLVSL